MKTAHVLRQVAFEDLGLLTPLLAQAGYAIRHHEAGDTDLPDTADLLIMLGGPIGACDEHDYPWLTPRLDLLRRQLAAGRPVLGICLGAQLLARAMGAGVTPMQKKEIGFAPLALTPAGQDSVLAALRDVPVLHWHGDQFGIPEDATLLAASRDCPHQAFSAGPRVLGLQCHLEADLSKLEHWLTGHAGELAAAGIRPGTLRHAAQEHGAALERAAEKVFQAWLAGLDN